MAFLKMTPKDLLFTKFDGTEDHFYEVVSDELDYPENYAVRIPALIELMTYGETYHRLLACIMLTSWGYKEGFQTLIKWATCPEKTPWYTDPVLHEHIIGSDSAFERLAEAIATSRYGIESQEISSLRKMAVKALLKLFSKVYFDNTLTLAIFSNNELFPEITEDVKSAIENSFDKIHHQEKFDFNLQLQVASLLGTLRDSDEFRVINYAKALVKEFPDDRRMLFELILVLGGCKSTEAFKILEELYQKNIDLKEHVLQAMERFKNVQMV
jgi:hypothetical protein